VEFGLWRKHRSRRPAERRRGGMPWQSSPRRAWFGETRTLGGFLERSGSPVQNRTIQIFYVREHFSSEFRRQVLFVFKSVRGCFTNSSWILREARTKWVKTVSVKLFFYESGIEFVGEVQACSPQEHTLPPYGRVVRKNERFFTNSKIVHSFKQ
jgi:hypothetical protein